MNIEYMINCDFVRAKHAYAIAFGSDGLIINIRYFLLFMLFRGSKMGKLMTMMSQAFI